MNDLNAKLPSRDRGQVKSLVCAELDAERKSLWRKVAVRAIVILALASYALWTASSGVAPIDPYLYAAISAVAGLLAADASLRIPQLVAVIEASKEPLSTDHTPSRRHRVVSATAAMGLWVAPVVAATGATWSGVGLAVALIPLVVFASNAIVRSSLGYWSRLPGQVAVEVMHVGVMDVRDLDDVDDEADAVVKA